MTDNIIYPGETRKVNYWIQRLGITHEQLNEAILETGSIRVKVIKNYLRKKKFSFSFSGLRTYIKLNI